MTRDLILLGVLGAPHGVRGEMRLKSYTEDPLAIADYKPLTDEAGARAFKILSARLVKDDMLVVRLEGVADRDKAAVLTNTRLYAPRDLLPPVEDEDEFYQADLIGLRVEARNGEAIGTVLAVLDFGAGDILEIEPASGGRPIMLPFTKAVVPHVDIAGGRLIAEPPLETSGEEEPPEEAV
ncbi:ribosome maturation factor RimM [Alsobacter metallidurans]|uniref:Ribosome maturation factor RimM n=1 Tax=Alsobacter metallidurans TaxID=340221 RepID=A0A917MK60_9HYPH|nr:ribosome maturation factor RimM [Alsobacter metallidurans]GGH33435.1 ribosome maturation factor RimM [Alsobacter metallidurans]